ncbi:MAG: hypothetical protein AB7S70_12410 [Hyphomicrobium sp.]|uniref:hypothetical protein n=1 Tax=Hyphomicrobium sp. TaxID=82 RepID=UPI003D0A4C48
MARLLICHVPKDGNAARDLGAALMGRGHFVSFDGEPDASRPDRSSRLRQFEAVLVVWTEFSAQSAGLAEIARETMPLNMLIPVRSADVALARLPLAYRKLNMLAPGDVDGIARLVARLSTAAASLRDMAEREAARHAAGPQAAANSRTPASQPASPPASPPRGVAQPRPQPARHAAGTSRQQAQPAPVARAGASVRPLSGLPEVDSDAAFAALGARRLDPPAAPQHAPPARSDAPQRPAARILTADDIARAVDAGLLVHHIPAAMWLGAPITIELTLGRDVLAALAEGEAGHGGRTPPAAPVIETLSVSLYGHPEAFLIERQAERTQFVSPKHALAARDPATFGRWVWLVTPHAAGAQDLVVRVSALLRDLRGVPAPVAIPDRRFTVDVQVPEGAGVGPALAAWHRGG